MYDHVMNFHFNDLPLFNCNFKKQRRRPTPECSCCQIRGNPECKGLKKYSKEKPTNGPIVADSHNEIALSDSDKYFFLFAILLSVPDTSTPLLSKHLWIIDSSITGIRLLIDYNIGPQKMSRSKSDSVVT